jgi:hypothetical protein
MTRWLRRTPTLYTAEDSPWSYELSSQANGEWQLSVYKDARHHETHAIGYQADLITLPTPEYIVEMDLSALLEVAVGDALVCPPPPPDISPTVSAAGEDIDEEFVRTASIVEPLSGTGLPGDVIHAAAFPHPSFYPHSQI